MTALLWVLGAYGALGLLCYVCYHAGKADEKNGQLQSSADAAGKAAAIRDRLLHDADYAAGVQNRFER